jgi:hypothetical protein
MRKPSPIAVWSAVGIASFGTVYDCGLFGVPDGNDHSALIVVAANGTVTTANGILMTANHITGDQITMSLPDHRTPQTTKA